MRVSFRLPNRPRGQAVVRDSNNGATATVLKVLGAALALQLIAMPVAGAQDSSVTSLFPAQPTGMVTDQANLIDDAVQASIEARLTRLRATTGAEVAVVTIPTLGLREPQEVALEIGRAWGVGAKAQIGDARRNAGLVLLLVPRTAERAGEVRFEVGDGLQGIITDAQSGQISDAMLPALRAGDFGEATDIGTRLVADRIVRDLGIQDSMLTEPRPMTNTRGIGKGFVYLIVLMVWFIVMAKRRGGRGGRGGGGRGGGLDMLLPILLSSLGGGRGGFGGGGGGGGGFGGFGGGGGFSGGGGGRSF